MEGSEKKCQDCVGAVSENRRRHPRYPFSSTAEVIDIQGNTRIVGRIADIAREGCYVDTISPFAPQVAASLKITRGKQTFETKATVVYSQVGMGMGLLFTSADPEQRRMLETWLAELRGEKVHEPDLADSAPPFDPGATKIVDQECRHGLSELVSLLSRKGILTVPERTAILQRVLK